MAMKLPVFLCLLAIRFEALDVHRLAERYRAIVVTSRVSPVAEPPPGRPPGAAGAILPGGVGAAAPARTRLHTQRSEGPRSGLLEFTANCLLYLAYYLVCNEGGKGQLTGMQKGATKIGLGLDDIKQFFIPLPPLPEQHEIVHRVEALFTLADCIEQRVSAGWERADRLTQAILAKAFRGELVPTEAELAKMEGREYEPAGVLLERIWEEREPKEHGEKARETNIKR